MDQDIDTLRQTHNRILNRDAGKNPAAMALGRLVGAKGGEAGATALSPRKRPGIAKKAAKAR